MSKGKISEELAILGVANVTEYGRMDSGWVKCNHGQHYAAIITNYDYSGDTITAKFQQAKSANGSFEKDITGKAITTITLSGYSIQIIDVSVDELDNANGFYWIQLQITASSASSIVTGLVVVSPDYKPATSSNIATVTQVV